MVGDFYEGSEYTHYMGRLPPVPASTRPVPYAATLPRPPLRTATTASPGARGTGLPLGMLERRGK